MRDAPVRPYLFFGGRCEEALEFYRAAIGAERGMVLRYDQSPQALPPGTLAPGFESKVMHSSFRVRGSEIMASDGTGPGAQFNGFRLALTFPTVAEVDRAFAALADGGRVDMPLEKTFFSPRYGMLTDRFGVAWMLMARE